MKALAVMASLALAASAVAAHGQDVAAGEQSFKKCSPCHSVGEGAKNKVGPQLNGLNGRDSGAALGYSYSNANKNSGITWNEETFKEYIKDPRAKIRGTKMIFPGIKNEKEARDLWAYLAQFEEGASQLHSSKRDTFQELGLFYLLYLTIDYCAKQFPEFNNPKSTVRDIAKNRESDIPADEINAVWNSVGVAFKNKFELMLRSLSTSNLYQECQGASNDIMGLAIIERRKPDQVESPPKKDF